MLGAVFHAITLLIIVVRACGTHLPLCHVSEPLAPTLPEASVWDTDMVGLWLSPMRASHLNADNTHAAIRLPWLPYRRSPGSAHPDAE